MKKQQAGEKRTQTKQKKRKRKNNQQRTGLTDNDVVVQLSSTPYIHLKAIISISTYTYLQGRHHCPGARLSAQKCSPLSGRGIGPKARVVLQMLRPLGPSHMGHQAPLRIDPSIDLLASRLCQWICKLAVCTNIGKDQRLLLKSLADSLSIYAKVSRAPTWILKHCYGCLVVATQVQENASDSLMSSLKFRATL